MDYHAVITFWFETLAPADWWRKNAALDRRIERDFGDAHVAACRCECHDWRREPLGRLAEIIVLDQFSRNIHRGGPAAFANDALAPALAQEAVTAKADAHLSDAQKVFLYMPFMHSESAAIHRWALALYRQPGLENNLGFEEKHKAIIDRFGRYPHRNAVLGRRSSAEESEFLKQPGSSF